MDRIKHSYWRDSPGVAILSTPAASRVPSGSSVLAECRVQNVSSTMPIEKCFGGMVADTEVDIGGRHG